MMENLENFFSLGYVLPNHKQPACCLNGTPPETAQNWRQFALPTGYAIWQRCPVCRNLHLSIVTNGTGPVKKRVDPEMFIDGYL